MRCRARYGAAADVPPGSARLQGDALRRRQPVLGCDPKVCSDPACLSAMGDLIVDRAGLTLYAGMTQFYLDGCHDVIF